MCENEIYKFIVNRRLFVCLFCASLNWFFSVGSVLKLMSSTDWIFSAWFFLWPTFLCILRSTLPLTRSGHIVDIEIRARLKRKCHFTVCVCVHISWVDTTRVRQRKTAQETREIWVTTDVKIKIAPSNSNKCICIWMHELPSVSSDGSRWIFAV